MDWNVRSVNNDLQILRAAGWLHSARCFFSAAFILVRFGIQHVVIESFALCCSVFESIT